MIGIMEPKTGSRNRFLEAGLAGTKLPLLPSGLIVTD
jgi:hypothetical protein